MTPESTSEALCSGEKRWGALPPNVCYTVFKDRAGNGHGGRGVLHDGNTAYSIQNKQEQNLCFSIEWHVVDRRLPRTGVDTPRDTHHTLNATDKHAVCYRKSAKPGADGSGESWVKDEKTNTLNTFEFHSEVRTPEVVLYPNKARCLTARYDSSLCADKGMNFVCYGQGGFAGYSEGVGTLKYSGGDAGGGTESIVVERV